MNKLRNSFALIVALATIGIILMSNKAVTGKSDYRESFRCFTDPITVKVYCSGPSQIISTSSTCEVAEGFQFIRAHIFGMNINNYIEDWDILAQCDGGDIFCCAQVIQDVTYTGGNFEGPCSGQPYFNWEGTNAQYEVFQVYCKYN